MTKFEHLLALSDEALELVEAGWSWDSLNPGRIYRRDTGEMRDVSPELWSLIRTAIGGIGIAVRWEKE